MKAKRRPTTTALYLKHCFETKKTSRLGWSGESVREATNTSEIALQKSRAANWEDLGAGFELV